MTTMAERISQAGLMTPGQEPREEAQSPELESEPVATFTQSVNRSPLRGALAHVEIALTGLEAARADYADNVWVNQRAEEVVAAAWADLKDEMGENDDAPEPGEDEEVVAHEAGPVGEQADA